MELTPTGAAILVIAVIAIIRVENALLYLLAFFLPFASTAIFNIPAMTFSATPYHIFGGLLVGLGMLRWTSSEITSKQLNMGSPFFWMVAFAAMMLASSFDLALTRGIGLTVILQSAILMLGFLVSWAIAERINTAEIANRLIVVYLWGGLFTALWGVFQWSCLNFGFSYPAEIFNNSISEAAANFDQTLKQTTYLVYRVSSVASEPSSVARFLISVLMIAIVMIGEGIGRVPFGRLYIYVISGVIALTTSSTGLLGLVIVFSVTLIFYTRAFLRDIVLMTLSGIMLLLASPKLADIVSSVTLEKEDSGSFDIRMSSMLYGYRAFTEAPFFGHGWGWFKGGSDMAMVNDLIFKFLSSVGLFGFSLFILFVLFGVLQAWNAIGRVGTGLGAPGLGDEERATGRFLRAATFGVMLSLLVCLFLDAVASFFYYAGNFWFMFGTMVGLSRVATAWAAQHEFPRMRGTAAGWRRVEAG